MAGSMQFDLVSPERSLASLRATQVQVPGAEGDFTAMADHAPVMTTLRGGVLTVAADDGDHEFVVTGGFAEVNSSGVTVLAEKAMARADMAAEDMAALIADAQAAVEGRADAELDRASKSLADVQASLAAGMTPVSVLSGSGDSDGAKYREFAPVDVRNHCAVRHARGCDAG